MRGIQALRDLTTPTREPDPADQLLDVAKTLRVSATVEKQRTPPNTVAARSSRRVSVPLDELRADPARQRATSHGRAVISRKKVDRMLEHLKDGGELPPITCRRRPDGSLWITDGRHRAAAHAIRGEQRVDAIVRFDRPRREPAVAKTRDMDPIVTHAWLEFVLRPRA